MLFRSYMEPHNIEIRSGMSADLTIFTSSKKDILKIPEIAVYQRDNKKFVMTLDREKQIEVSVKTGISDGESIEITDGLSAGQVVVVSTD